MRKALVLALVLGVAACDSGGGDDFPGAGPVSMDTALSGCTAVCEHEFDCGTNTALDVCIDVCVDSAVGILRADFFDDRTACYVVRACGDATPCNACTPTPAHTGFEARCTALFSQCGATPDEVDRLCRRGESFSYGQMCMFSEDIVTELRACMPSGAECVDAYACIRAVFDEHGVR